MSMSATYNEHHLTKVECRGEATEDARKEWETRRQRDVPKSARDKKSVRDKLES